MRPVRAKFCASAGAGDYLQSSQRLTGIPPPGPALLSGKDLEM